MTIDHGQGARRRLPRTLCRRRPPAAPPKAAESARARAFRVHLGQTVPGGVRSVHELACLPRSIRERRARAARRRGGGRPGRLPDLSAQLRRRSPERRPHGLQGRPQRARLVALPPFRRGGLPARLERERHHLLHVLQPALRLLPELGDFAGGGGARARRTRARELMLELQRRGCHNINFVTPEHVVPQILEALLHASGSGLRLPIVYNTSAYDSMESLRWMDGVVDIYMPDFKYWSSESAARILKARDYPDVARRTIAEMHRQVGPFAFDAEGLARRGLLVRHLVMPGALEETREILAWVARELGPDTYVNVMDQYRPEGRVLREPERFAELT